MRALLIVCVLAACVLGQDEKNTKDRVGYTACQTIRNNRCVNDSKLAGPTDCNATEVNQETGVVSKCAPTTNPVFFYCFAWHGKCFGWCPWKLAKCVPTKYYPNGQIAKCGCKTKTPCQAVKSGKTWGCKGYCPKGTPSYIKCAPSKLGQEVAGESWASVQPFAKRLCDCDDCRPVADCKSFTHFFQPPVVSTYNTNYHCSISHYIVDACAGELHVHIDERGDYSLGACQPPMSSRLNLNPVSSGPVFPISNSLVHNNNPPVSEQWIGYLTFDLSALTVGATYHFRYGTSGYSNPQLLVVQSSWFQSGFKCTTCKADEEKCVKTPVGWKYSQVNFPTVQPTIIDKYPFCHCKNCTCQEIDVLKNKCVQDCKGGKCIPVLDYQGQPYKPGKTIGTCACKK